MPSSAESDGRNGHHASKHRRRHLSEVGSHLVAASGEFVGTFLFLYFGYAGNIMAILQAPSLALNSGMASNTDIWIAMSYGFSLLVNVWAFYRISGGLFNPAVTLGMYIAGQLPWMRAAFLFPAQLLGSMCAGGLVAAMFPGNISQANTLVFVVLMLAAEKSEDTFLAPVGIGLALFVVLIPGVFVTGGAANPVRSFGCAVAGTDFPGYHWIYWVGPALGACVAACYFRFVKMMHYEEANPGQDSPTDV